MTTRAGSARIAFMSRVPEGRGGRSADPTASAHPSLNGGWGSGWHFHAPPGTSARFVDRGGLRGGRCIALTGDGSGGRHLFPVAYQVIASGDLTGRRLRLAARVRRVGVVGPGFALALRGEDATRAPRGGVFASTQGRIDIFGTADWTEYSVRLEELDASVGRVSVFLMLLPETRGTVYVDDVTLTSESLPALRSVP